MDKEVEPTASGGTGKYDIFFLLGLLFLVIFSFLFFYFGLPFIIHSVTEVQGASPYLTERMV